MAQKQEILGNEQQLYELALLRVRYRNRDEGVTMTLKELHQAAEKEFQREQANLRRRLAEQKAESAA